MDEQQRHDNENDDFEIRADLKGVSVRAGGGWKKYLGPWLGPIVLVAVFGAAVGLIVTAFFAANLVMK